MAAATSKKGNCNSMYDVYCIHCVLDAKYRDIIRQSLGDLVGLLAGNAPVISTFSFHLLSAQVIPEAIHRTVTNANLSPDERVTQLFTSVYSTFETSSNPRDIFLSLLKSLDKVGLKPAAKKLEEKAGKIIRTIEC